MIKEITRENKERREVVPRHPNPLEVARNWRQEMENDPTLNQAKIAGREGISRARVTQITNLLKLPAEIQNVLLCPPPPLEIHRIPERRLRSLVRCRDVATQVRYWRELLQELGGLGGK